VPVPELEPVRERVPVPEQALELEPALALELEPVLAPVLEPVRRRPQASSRQLIVPMELIVISFSL